MAERPDTLIEFYKSERLFVGDDKYGWRIKEKENGAIIAIPGELFDSHRNAVESFKRVCDALNARGPWEIKDLDGIVGSHAMLTSRQGNIEVPGHPPDSRDFR